MVIKLGFKGFNCWLYSGIGREWLDNLDNYNASKSLQGHINQLSELITDIPLTNGDEEVEKYEKTSKRQEIN